jgi:hypothetical protein
MTNVNSGSRLVMGYTQVGHRTLAQNRQEPRHIAALARESCARSIAAGFYAPMTNQRPPWLDSPGLSDDERAGLLLAHRELVESGMAVWDAEAVQLELVYDEEEHRDA